MEIEAEGYVLHVSLSELDSIADGLRTVLPRYDMPDNKYHRQITAMLKEIDLARGIAE